MIAPDRRGTLWRTSSIADTGTLAADVGARYVSALDQLPEGGTAVLDLDDAPTATSIDICSRFRGMGVSLAVAARPGALVPFEVRRNLAHGE